MARFSSVERLLSGSGTLYARTYDRGRIEIRFVDEATASGEAVLHGVPGVSEFVLRGLAYGIEATLRITRSIETQVRWRRTADGAVLSIRGR